MTRKPKRVHEQAVVYLDARDSELLAKVAGKTGLPKTEVFRRALHRWAAETLPERAAGSSLAHLVATASDDAFPPDLAARHDEYLYGGRYQKPRKRKSARTR